MSVLKRTDANGLVTLTINRPAALNALNAEVLIALKTEFESLKVDFQTAVHDKSFTENTPRVVLLRGAGEKAFVAGADISELKDATGGAGGAFLDAGIHVMRSIEDLPLPVVACVNGFCLGGGFELALSCDLIIASENSKFGLPEITLSLVPGFGGTQRLPRRIGTGLSRRLIFTGDMITAEQAANFGAVDWIFPGDKFEGEIERISRQLIERSPLALETAKRAVTLADETGKSEGLNREEELFMRLLRTRDAKEGLSAFLEKRKPKFKGA